jgi:hypothetical protein
MCILENGLIQTVINSWFLNVQPAENLNERSLSHMSRIQSRQIPFLCTGAVLGAVYFKFLTDSNLQRLDYGLMKLQ